MVKRKHDTADRIVKTVYPDAFGLEEYNNPHQLKDAKALAKRIRRAIKAERVQIIGLIRAYKRAQFKNEQRHQVFTCDDIIALIMPATKKGAK